jgi:hypothetical protein
MVLLFTSFSPTEDLTIRLSISSGSVFWLSSWMSSTSFGVFGLLRLRPACCCTPSASVVSSRKPLLSDFLFQRCLCLDPYEYVPFALQDGAEYQSFPGGGQLLLGPNRVLDPLLCPSATPHNQTLTWVPAAPLRPAFLLGRPSTSLDRPLTILNRMSSFFHRTSVLPEGPPYGPLCLLWIVADRPLPRHLRYDMQFKIFPYLWKGVIWCRLMPSNFLGICKWWNSVHCLLFSLYCECQVNFQIPSANILVVALFWARLMSSYRSERIILSCGWVMGSIG